MAYGTLPKDIPTEGNSVIPLADRVAERVKWCIPDSAEMSLILCNAARWLRVRVSCDLAVLPLITTIT